VLQATAWAEANEEVMELRRLKWKWGNSNKGKLNPSECPTTLEALRAWWADYGASANYVCSCGEFFEGAGAFYSHCGRTGHTAKKCY